MKIILISILSLLVACGTAPRMERPILVWNGSPEAGGVCKLPTQAMKELLKQNPQYEMFLKDPRAIVCLKATNDKFKEYGAISFDDIEIIQRHMARLENSCRVWK